MASTLFPGMQRVAAMVLFFTSLMANLTHAVPDARNAPGLQGGFRTQCGTCFDIEYQDNRLYQNFMQVSAWCQPDKGGSGFGINSFIDFNQCIANDDGDMIWREGGGALHSCSCSNKKPLWQYPGILDCYCKHKDTEARGSLRYNLIDLNDGIWCRNGLIGCWNHLGTSNSVPVPSLHAGN